MSWELQTPYPPSTFLGFASCPIGLSSVFLFLINKMCDHSEIEASEVTDGNISWGPLSSDSDVKAIVEKMKTLDTGKVIGEGAKTVTDEGNEESKDKEAEEVGKDKDVGDGKMEVEKVKEEEAPDFGVEDDNEVEFQKVVETDKDVASDAIIPLKPRKDLMSVPPDASDVDGAASFALPSAKARARSIPPVSRSKSKPRAKSLATQRLLHPKRFGSLGVGRREAGVLWLALREPGVLPFLIWEPGAHTFGVREPGVGLASVHKTPRL